MSAIPVSLSVLDVAKANRSTLEKNLSGVRRQDTGEDFHKRGFAGSVFADHSKDFARIQPQANFPESLYTRKGLANSYCFQGGRSGAGIGFARGVDAHGSRSASRTP
jgi:hypothetical protein